MQSNSMNIVYGQMDAHVNLNLHDQSIGCVTFIRNQALSIARISLTLIMENENMMVQGHV